MPEEVIINGRSFQAENYAEDTDGHRRIIKFDFEVTHSTYHDVTVLLYEEEFRVSVPERNLSFPAEIHNYIAPFTNLYEEGASGEFHLELIEVLD